MNLNGYKVLGVWKQLRRLSRLTRLFCSCFSNFLLSIVPRLFKALLQLDHGFNLL